MAPKAGIIGWPVAHSLSPRLHRYWLDAYNIPGEYVMLPAEPKDLAKTMASLPTQGFCGANITVPHKETVMKLLDETDETARAIGAVNTVIIKGGTLRGTNTDAYGFVESLRQGGGLGVRGKAVVLGAGGAAKAVCKALSDENFSGVIVVCRSPEKGFGIRDSGFGKKKNIAIKAWEERNTVLAGADLLVNATSLGMQGKEALDIDLALLPTSATVMDLVYAPLITPLLVQAQKRGHNVIDGLNMLIHQAVPAFEAWFGVRPQADKETREHLLHG